MATQEAYRFRDHDNASVALSSTSWGVAQDINASFNPSRRFRLRVQVGESGSLTTAYKLQYRKNAETFADVAINSPGDSSLRGTGSVDPVEIVENSAYADQDPTTDLLTGGTGTFVAGDGMDTTITSGSIALTNQHTELEWSLWFHFYDDAGAALFADGDTIDFRVVQSDNTLLTYSVTPTVTVDVPDGYLDFNAVESPGHHGPFIDTNGNMYAVLETDAHNTLPVVVKSTDGGLAWSPVDVAGKPTKSDLEGFDVRQEGDVLHIAHWATGGTDGVFYHRFNMSDHTSPDQWAEIDTVVDDGGGAGLARRDQSVTMEVLSNGDLAILYTYETAPVEIGMRRRISGTWDTTTTVVWDNANGDFRGVTSVIDPVTDIIYAFAKDDATADLTGKSIVTSTWTIQNLFADTETAVGTLVDDSLDNTLRHEMNFTPPILWDDGGTKKVWISFLFNTEQLHGRLVTVGSGGSVSARRGPINDSEQIGGNVGQGRMPNATIARDSSGTLHAVFDRTADASTATEGDLYHATSDDDGVTWSADTLVGSRSWGSRISEVRAKFITRGGADYIGYVFYDANQYEEDLGLGTFLGHDSGEFQGYMWYDEISLSTAPFTGLILGSPAP